MQTRPVTVIYFGGRDRKRARSRRTKADIKGGKRLRLAARQLNRGMAWKRDLGVKREREREEFTFLHESRITRVSGNLWIFAPMKHICPHPRPRTRGKFTEYCDISRLFASHPSAERGLYLESANCNLFGRLQLIHGNHVQGLRTCASHITPTRRHHASGI